MATVERLEDLCVWQESRTIVGAVYRLTARFPPEERYGLSSQLRRAAVSTMSNIAEGFERGTNWVRTATALTPYARTTAHLNLKPGTLNLKPET